MQIDAEMARPRHRHRGRGRLVISADHGLIDVPAADQVLSCPTNPLLAPPQVPPSGDARMPLFT
jgi:hypothetical protein